MLEKVDLFGVPFTFTTFHHEKFKTKLGGIFTIVACAVLLVSILLFGKEFFYRLNPKIISQVYKPEEYTKHYFKNNNFTIPWRLEDVSAINFNFTGFLYPIIKLTNYVFKDGKWNYEFYQFEIETCEGFMQDELLEKKINPKEWYCLNLDKIPEHIFFGGYWDTNFVNHFMFDFYTCPNNDITSKNCTKLEDLKYNMNSAGRLYFVTLFRTDYFSAKEYNTSFNKQYLYYFQTLNPNLLKIDRTYFRDSILEDDKGWIFEDKSTFTTLSFDHYFNSMDLKTDVEYENLTESRIYSYYMYMELTQQLYFRSYTRIQDLAAQVGGIFKIILLFFSVIANYFNRLYRTNRLIMEMCDCYEVSSNENPFINLEIKTKKNVSNKPVNSEFIILKDNLPQLNVHSSASNLDKNLEIAKNFSNLVKLSREPNLLRNYGIKYILCRNFCFKKNNNFSLIAKNYVEVNKSIKRKLDVVFYLNLIKQFDSLLSINLTKEQIYCLKNNMKKVNLLDTTEGELPKSENEEIEMLLYFIRKYQQDAQPFTNKKDNKLFELMTNRHKQFVRNMK